jgi:hypothetical protein
MLTEEICKAREFSFGRFSNLIRPTESHVSFSKVSRTNSGAPKTDMKYGLMPGILKGGHHRAENANGMLVLGVKPERGQ